MKQECPMLFIYLSWLVYVGGVVYFSLQGDWAFALAWLIFLPLFIWVYIISFPRISRFIGYGRVDDQEPNSISHAPAKVTFYVALGCPFCPVVERRLEKLQCEIGFELEKVDITLKPGLLAKKGIRSVPVVEVGDRHLVGHATSEQLAQLILGKQHPA